MAISLHRFLRRLAATLGLALLGTGGAQAGLVTGAWDPQFGVALPNLSWQVRAAWLVPNSCSAAADGVYSTAQPSGPCESTIPDPVRLLGVWVRWFDTNAGDPNDFFQHVNPISAHTGWCESVFATGNPDCAVNMSIFNQGNEPLSATNIRVAQNQVVGFDTNLISFLTQGWPTSAGTHVFDLSFTTNGPVFTCRNSIVPPTPPTDTSCNTPVNASTADLDQFLVTYTSNNTTTPKFTDANGNALGAVLDGAGNYIGQRAVPEPGALVLAMGALGILGLIRRRRG